MELQEYDIVTEQGQSLATEISEVSSGDTQIQLCVRVDI